jgi:hypothetical protein
MGEIGGCGKWDAFVCERFWRMKEFGGGDAVNPLSMEFIRDEVKRCKIGGLRNYLA